MPSKPSEPKQCMAHIRVKRGDDTYIQEYPYDKKDVVEAIKIIKHLQPAFSDAVDIFRLMKTEVEAHKKMKDYTKYLKATFNMKKIRTISQSKGSKQEELIVYYLMTLFNIYNYKVVSIGFPLDDNDKTKVLNYDTLGIDIEV